jgi:calmodulin
VIDFQEFMSAFAKVRQDTYTRARAVFDRLDVDHNGVIDKKEFQEAAAKLGIRLTDADVGTLFDEFDKNGDGVIQFEEFMTITKALGL